MWCPPRSLTPTAGQHTDSLPSMRSAVFPCVPLPRCTWGDLPRCDHRASVLPGTRRAVLTAGHSGLSAQRLRGGHLHRRAAHPARQHRCWHHRAHSETPQRVDSARGLRAGACSDKASVVGGEPGESEEVLAPSTTHFCTSASATSPSVRARILRRDEASCEAFRVTRCYALLRHTGAHTTALAIRSHTVQRVEQERSSTICVQSAAAV